MWTRSARLEKPSRWTRRRHRLNSAQGLLNEYARVTRSSAMPRRICWRSASVVASRNHRFSSCNKACRRSSYEAFASISFRKAWSFSRPCSSPRSCCVRRMVMLQDKVCSWRVGASNRGAYRHRSRLDIGSPRLSGPGYGHHQRGCTSRNVARRCQSAISPFPRRWEVRESARHLLRAVLPPLAPVTAGSVVLEGSAEPRPRTVHTGRDALSGNKKSYCRSNRTRQCAHNPRSGRPDLQQELSSDRVGCDRSHELGAWRLPGDWTHNQIVWPTAPLAKGASLLPCQPEDTRAGSPSLPSDAPCPLVLPLTIIHPRDGHSRARPHFAHVVGAGSAEVHPGRKQRQDHLDIYWRKQLRPDALSHAVQ